MGRWCDLMKQPVYVAFAATILYGFTSIGMKTLRDISKT